MQQRIVSLYKDLDTVLNMFTFGEFLISLLLLPYPES